MLKVTNRFEKRAAERKPYSRTLSAYPGFALIATVTLMVLLTLLALGMVSLSALSLRSVSRDGAMGTARANARMAMLVAIGQLQICAGPDQRITGPGSLAGDNVKNPHWTGVWSASGALAPPAWLVSGNENRGTDFTNPGGQSVSPGDDTGKDWVVLRSSPEPGQSVSVPTVPLRSDGRYGWWVSDEGCKARVDVRRPDAIPAPTKEDRLSRSLVPQENSLRHVDERFAPLAPVADAQTERDSRRILTVGSMDLLGGGAAQALSRQYFHDLTTGGYGLPVNVVDGGMKTDLSIAFDSSQATSSYPADVMGATPKLANEGQSGSYYNFSTITKPATFHLIPELTDKNNAPTGPNWGILYNYCQLWRNTSAGSSMYPIVMRPVVETDMRSNTWPPYQKAGSDFAAGNLKRDRQHTNTSVAPVMSMVQVGFRLSSLKLSDGTYQLRLQIKPVIGLWNPYNIRIQPHRYRIKWALYPYLRLGVEKPDGTVSETRTWLRTLWLKSGLTVNPDDPNADVFLDLRTPVNIDLQPGEIRLFSVGTNPSLTATNDLVSSWNEQGAFVMNLVDQTTAGAATPVIVPAGSRVWYEDLLLLDVQHPDTWEHFGSSLTDSNTASWFSLSSWLINDGAINRISDFWQTPKSTVKDDLPYMIPEPVASGEPGSDSASPRVAVEDITNSGSPLHIGTWRCIARNASDAPDTQKVRGWVDANLRCGPGNPLWDGSRPLGANGYEGWNFLSPYVGGSTSGDPYDGGPPGRGKVAEGQNEASASPEATMSAGRYRGFGGLSIGSSGQTHVPIFDVPRGALVSLGQLQHAQFSRYQYEPAMPFGNSYANPRIPLGETKVNNYMDVAGFTMFDISYGLNNALWDKYFFSTIGRDYVAPSSPDPLDTVLNFSQVNSGAQPLPNPRHKLHPRPADLDFAGILQKAGSSGPRALAARIGIEGAFNVNSTSPEAWKAVLASMADFEFPVVSTDGTTLSWAGPKGVRFPKFGHVLAQNGWEPADGPLSADFWQGYRKISGDELDSLAEEIVEEVRSRGPFRSFAEFVNRNPAAGNAGQQRKGALQAALDRALNADLLDEIGGAVSNQPKGSQFSQAFDGEGQAQGYAGYLMQGDVLQALAPILQVRSDYFRIRAAGQCLDANGVVIAQATCEAFVQRTADYTDQSGVTPDPPENGGSALTSEANRKFGRRFEIVSFRWLAPEEI